MSTIILIVAGLLQGNYSNGPMQVEIPTPAKSESAPVLFATTPPTSGLVSQFDETGPWAVVTELDVLIKGPGDTVFAAGGWSSDGGRTYERLLYWDGSAWHPLGGGINDGYVRALAYWEGNLYVGGNFTNVAGEEMRGIARWDGRAWHDLAGGIDDGAVAAIAIGDSGLYIGGSFSSVSGRTANRIARWDGLAWDGLGEGQGNGVDGSITALAVADSWVYAAGDFEHAGGTSASYVARWDGSAWHPLSSPTRLRGVRTMATDGQRVYIAGTFRGLVARWNGSEWDDVALDISGPVAGGVFDMDIRDDLLYVVGTFYQQGVGELRHGAQWDGDSWQFIDASITNGGGLQTIVATESHLWVGGTFTELDGREAFNGARWEGRHWTTKQIFPESSVGPAFIRTIVREINRLRARGGECGGIVQSPTHALSWNSELQEASRQHAEDMSANQFLGHVGSDGSTVADRVRRAAFGGRTNALGENAWLHPAASATVRMAIEAWYASEGHCRNMFYPGFRYMGAARIGDYWAIKFG